MTPEEALEEQGFTPFLAFGFAQRGEEYVIRGALVPFIRQLSPETLHAMIAIVTREVQGLLEGPLDDLEVEGA